MEVVEGIAFMGIENRDYMEGRSSSSWGGGSYRPGGRSMVTTLIIVNVIIFLLQLLTHRTLLLETWFALNINDVLHGQIWRLTTYDFLHDTGGSTPTHLIFNMLLLYIAGKQVEEKYGSKEFLAFYLVAGILSGLVFMLWGIATKTGGVAIGASGAAVSVMVVYAMNWPRQVWLIWGILPIPVAVIAILSAIFDVMPMILQLTGQGGGGRIAHAAHVGGMLFGVIYVYFNLRITSLFGETHMKQFSQILKPKPKLKVHVPEPELSSSTDDVPEEIENRLDRLLEKISQHGEASLSDEERRFLSEASRRYRNRR